MTEEKIKFTIDGREVDATPGQTILQAALDAGIYIPYLCYYPGMKPYGACRMCVVEVEGARGTPASCTTPVADGMAVHSKTGEAQETRQGIMELLISEHPHGCLTCHRVELCGPEDICQRHVGVNDRCVACPKNERCELKDTTRFVGVSMNTPFTYNNRGLQVETGDPFYDIDYNLCIVCGRCVRACEEVRGDNAIAFIERAGHALVGTSQGTSLLESGCEFCGSCIDVCPTGALTERDSKWDKAVHRVTTTCTFCPVGCQIKLEVDKRGKVIRAIGDPGAEANRGQLCFKGKFGMGFINHRSRLRQPLVRRNGNFEAVEWDEALRIVAERFVLSKENQFAAVASPRNTNEELYLLQKFTRTVMGTNNIDYATNVQPEKLSGLQDTLGYPAATNPIWDLEQSGCILVVSANVTEEHNVVAVPIKRAVKEGSHLIVIDPREVELTRHATLWLRPRPGSELLLLGGMMRAIVDEVAEDTEYLKEYTANLDILKRTLARHFDLERITKETGVAKELIREAASLFAKTNPAAIVYALDTVPAEQTLDITHAITNLALLTGNIGKPGGGVYPLLHGANAQGAWDVGCLPSLLPGYRRVDDDTLRAELEQMWNTVIPKGEGIGIQEMSKAVNAGRIKTMLVFGEDSIPVDESFDRLDFLVVHANFLDGLAQQADVVLPASTFAEATGTYTNLERRIQALNPALETREGQDRSALSVICDLARIMEEKGFEFDSPESVFREITYAVSTYEGCTYGKLVGNRQLQPAAPPGYPLPQQFYPTSPGLSSKGIQWPLLAGLGTPVLYGVGFPSGKAQLVEVSQPAFADLTNSEFPILLARGRVLHQPERELRIERNGSNRIKRDETVEIHPGDANLLGLNSGDSVSLTTIDGLVISAVVKLVEDIHRGMISLTTLFGELATELEASKEYNAMAKVPTLPLQPVRVDKLI